MTLMVRRVAALLVLTMAAVGLTTAAERSTAEAFAIPPAPVLLPSTLGLGLGAGTGAATAVGGAAAGTAGAVAVAPVAIAAAAVLGTAAAVYIGWKWATGDSAGTKLDPSTAPAGSTAPSGNYNGAYTATWLCKPTGPYDACAGDSFASPHAGSFTVTGTGGSMFYDVQMGGGGNGTITSAKALTPIEIVGQPGKYRYLLTTSNGWPATGFRVYESGKTGYLATWGTFESAPATVNSMPFVATSTGTYGGQFRFELTGVRREAGSGAIVQAPAGYPEFRITLISDPPRACGYGSSTCAGIGYNSALGNHGNELFSAKGESTTRFLPCGPRECWLGNYGESPAKPGLGMLNGPDGQPYAAPPPSGSTTVTTTPTSKCSNGSTVTGTAITYKGSTPAAQLPPLVAPACPAGTTRTGFQTPTKFPDGSTAPSPTADFAAPAIPAAYPECLAAPCQLTLVSLKPGFAGTPDSEPHVCNNNTGCAGVHSWPRTGTKVKTRTKSDTASPSTDPATWGGTETRPKDPKTGNEAECRYGPYRVPMDECVVVPTENPVDPPVDQGQSESNCNLSDFSLNPITWVVVPLKCLFIPRSGFAEGKLDGVKTKFSTSGPGAYMTAFGGVGGAVAEIGKQAAGCGGPSFTVNLYKKPYTLKPLNACPGAILAPIAPVVRVLLLIGLYLGAATVAARVLAASFGLSLPSFGDGSRT